MPAVRLSILRYLGTATTALIAASFLFASPALAAHGNEDEHIDGAMTVSNDTDINNGDLITVELSNWNPDSTITVVTCWNFPIVGPGDCSLANYGQHTAKVAEDGTATVEYPVRVLPGRCDSDIPCFIVASDGIGPSSNSAAVKVTFAATESPTTTELATTTTEPPTTTTQPPTTTTAPTTTTSPPAAEPPAAQPATPASDGGGMSVGLIVLLIIVGVSVITAGVVVFARRRGK